MPLGKSRLALAKLLAALISTNTSNLNQALAEANTLTILLDLFFEYSLNNFLHAQVKVIEMLKSQINTNHVLFYSPHNLRNS